MRLYTLVLNVDSVTPPILLKQMQGQSPDSVLEKFLGFVLDQDNAKDMGFESSGFGLRALKNGVLRYKAICDFGLVKMSSTQYIWTTSLIWRGKVCFIDVIPTATHDAISPLDVKPCFGFSIIISHKDALYYNEQEAFTVEEALRQLLIKMALLKQRKSILQKYREKHLALDDVIAIQGVGAKTLQATLLELEQRNLMLQPRQDLDNVWQAELCWRGHPACITIIKENIFENGAIERL